MLDEEAAGCGAPESSSHSCPMFAAHNVTGAEVFTPSSGNSAPLSVVFVALEHAQVASSM